MATAAEYVCSTIEALAQLQTLVRQGNTYEGMTEELAELDERAWAIQECLSEAEEEEKA